MPVPSPRQGQCAGFRVKDAASKDAGFWGCDSLNSDPFNLRAEELALQDCAFGVEVRRTWTEQEMVRSFGGQMSPGTPDGMFESWDGELTCVQVVRVPLTEEADVQSMQDTLVQTVLTKVVKSQSWLRFTQAMPHDFVIFCWLPCSVPQAVSEYVEQLMERVRKLDCRFSLRLRIPAEPSSIFPALFASNHEARVKARSRSLTESDVSSFVEGDFSEDEDEGCSWDITWGWDADLPESLEAAEQTTWELAGFASNSSTPQHGVDDGTATDEDDDYECEWNITWDDKG
eukprot:gb/GFBE01033203.1/.p2 GENE.gb/GFBE01033203.1/~~gb/GFBE01033203.1/.p2  ORF type:complete len:287 (-),score=68.56 gb/GFBE01033203.1/:55-915(-)